MAPIAAVAATVAVVAPVAVAAAVDTVDPSAPARSTVGVSGVVSYGLTPAPGVLIIAIVQVSFDVFTDIYGIILSQQKSIFGCFPELPIPGLLLTDYLVEIYI